MGSQSRTVEAGTAADYEGMQLTGLLPMIDHKHRIHLDVTRHIALVIHFSTHVPLGMGYVVYSFM